MRLRIDHAAAAAVSALDDSGIPSVILKGPSITRWLYEPEDARAYVDCDLLVAPDTFAAAVQALIKAGHHPELDELSMPSWWREHALTTFSVDGSMVDLHRNLPGVGADDALLWSTLSAVTDPILVGGVAARTLTKPGRLMHAALHAAQHGGASRDLDVLARALERVGEETWREAAELADRLDAAAAFTRGLMMLPGGVELVAGLGLNPAPSLEVELRAASARQALTVARLHQTRGLRARLALVRHKLFPPVTFMRKWSALARRGRLGLALAYLYRPLWVARRTPAAVRTWQAARRAVNRQAETQRPPGP
ncbi:nucleotidyltransferase family protein [Conexibacter sp. S30A1]|uniref:nucleotidyltransferase family protein n=1 Tax=Conexibacter sp. S30A1 TaxID=2937800 RepID=UPI00200D07B3|nr:nucleotidyltransferase family protein [Conexibacter sp. S30A1]